MRIIHICAKHAVIARIINPLEHCLENQKNDLFFVGYQVAGIPGRAIMEDRTPAKAAIHRLTGYSAHADQQTLCDWVAAMPEPPGGGDPAGAWVTPYTNRFSQKIEPETQHP